MTLIVVPESTTSLRGLWNEALPEVIRELETGGYTVDQENAVEADCGTRMAAQIRRRPGLRHADGCCQHQR